MRSAIAMMLLGLVGQGQGNRDVKVVKYSGLGDIVFQNRGKVVVVDLWGIG